ncbi:tRNA 2-selenouridine synthase [compost metagenome]
MIDVRAPVEFAQGHLPGAVNLPILNDEERALIGTTYKQQGRDVAVKLGYELISGPIKESRLQAWSAFIKENPQSVIYCFRGGMRSQITQGWLKEQGLERPLIVGGYKKARHFFLEELNQLKKNFSFVSVSGPTGSGKTKFLQEADSLFPHVDLEALACHRGSAFGAMKSPQPAQINFENQLALSLMKINRPPSGPSKVLVEDESRMIGQCVQPLPFFEHLREAPIFWIDEPLETRIENVYQDYILDSAMASGDQEPALNVFKKYKQAVNCLQKRLGGLRTQEILDLLDKAEHEFLDSKTFTGNKAWIERLLVYYYDPIYLGSLERRQVQVIFKGTYSNCLSFLRSFE